MIKIVKVIPREDYCLEVILDNGSSVIVSFQSRLNTIRFGLLEDTDFFNTVSTDGRCITWDGKIDISLSEIFQLLHK